MKIIGFRRHRVCRLGHASVSITLDVYSHVLPTNDTEAAAKVAGLILGG